MSFNINVENVGSLSEREATALGMMFMHIAGHEMYPGEQETIRDIPQDEIDEEKIYIPIDEELLKNAPPVPKESAWPNPKDEEPVFPEVHLDQLLRPTMPVAPPAPQESLAQPPVPPMPPMAVASQERDSAGITWDARIHAKNKALTVKGEWKLGRNIPEQLVKAVLHELRSQRATPGVTLPPIPAIPSVAPPAPATPAAPAVPYVPAPPAAPFFSENPNIHKPAVNTPAAPVIDEDTGFDALIERVSGLVSQNKVTIPQVLNIVSAYKDNTGRVLCNSLAMVSQYPEFIPAINMEIDKLIGA